MVILSRERGPIEIWANIHFQLANPSGKNGKISKMMNISPQKNYLVTICNMESQELFSEKYFPCRLNTHLSY